MIQRIGCCLLVAFVLIQCGEKKTPGGMRKTDKLVEAFFEDGTLQSTTPLKDGKPEGLATEYYRSGVKSREIQYRKGLKHGVFRRFSREGQMVEESTYSYDLLNGPQKKFTKEGKIHSEAFFINGNPCVGLKEYLPSGALRQEYPQLTITPVDHVTDDGTFRVRINLTSKAQVDYFVGQLTDGKYIGEDAKPIPLNDFGDGEITYQMKRGESLREKINIIANIRTVPLKNAYITQQEYEVVIRKH